MKPFQDQILVVDNALAPDEALSLSQRCLDAEIFTADHKGTRYTGIVKGVHWDGEPMLHRHLSSLIVCSVGQWQVKIRQPMFRFCFMGLEQAGWIHADDAESDYAAVLHLSDAGIGGTAFFRHTDTGLYHIPREGAIRDIIANDTYNEAGRFRLDTLVGLRFNRLVIYETSRLHARYPKEPWGTNKATGRLIYAAFFNLI